MNRKSKIIVSVVGISIVLLALLGITYAYYLTRIQGNTNTNSISVSTADLKLVYGDGNGLVTANDIMPGTTITKTFTVTNSGNSKVNGYVVVLENIVNTLTRTEDLVYTLTCKLNDSTSCGFTEEVVYPSGKPLSVIFTNDIETETTHNYTLTVTYKNLTDVDQSDDMGKTFSGKVNIYDANQVNPYSLTETSNNATSLTYNIINNALTNANGTTFRTSPLTTPVKESSGGEYLEKGENPTSYIPATPIVNRYFVYSDDYTVTKSGAFKLTNPTVYQYTNDLTPLKGKYITNAWGYTETNANTNATVGKTFSSIFYVGEDTTTTILSYGEVIKHQESIESTLSITQDIYGTSYYFRGSVQDNFVLFNNMCFRIVRIEGDGSVKLIYAGDTSIDAEDCSELGSDTGILTDEDGYIYARYGNNDDLRPDYFGYVYDPERTYDYEGRSLREELANWFDEKNEDYDMTVDLKNDKWCFEENEDNIYDIDTGVLVSQDEITDWEYYYLPGNRLLQRKTTSLMCEQSILFSSYYGILTADEVMLAGGVYNKKNQSYYLYDNVQTESFSTFSVAVRVGDTYGDGDLLLKVSGGELDFGLIYDGFGVRPSITLIPGTTIVEGGNGTKTNPYIIDIG